MRKLYPDFHYILGDVSLQRQPTNLKSVRYVFNFAASKHVDICESNTMRAMDINLNGVINTYRAASAAGARYIFTSTDKAVLPVNAYGAAKLLAEKYLYDMGDAVVYRWGNILGSRGSVLPILQQCRDQNKTFTLTHPDMTRFWANIDDVAAFMWEHKDDVTDTEAHIPPMKAASMVRLCEAMGVKYEVGEIRPGEKIHEVLRTGHDFCVKSNDPELQMSDDELMSLIARSL
jgi:FlaA1/EpsC-like NDP-sugar epimerase